MTSDYFKTQVTVSVAKRKKHWIAFCPALKTFGYSDKSGDAAIKDFDRAVETFFFVQKKLGVLNNTLLNLGWTVQGNVPIAPRYNTYTPAYWKDKVQNIEHSIQVPAH